VLSDNIRDRQLWEFLFADDFVITAESKEQLQRRVLEWQGSLERQGLKVNARKTEEIVCGKTDMERVKIVDKGWTADTSGQIQIPWLSAKERWRL